MLKLSHLFIAGFFVLCTSTSFAFAKQPDVNKKIEELQNSTRHLQSNIDSLKQERQDHDRLIENIKGLNDVENRVEDIHQNVAYIGIVITMFGIFLTGMILFFSIRTANEAKVEARKAAEVEIMDWIARNGEKAIQPLKQSLQDRADQILEDIRNQGNETIGNFENLSGEYQQKANTFLNQLSDSLNNIDKPLDTGDSIQLERIVKMLNFRPVNTYTFDDWRALYWDALNRQAYDEVRKYLDALDGAAKGEWQYAITRNMRGILLFNTNCYSDAEKLYSELIDKYKEDKDPRMTELVIKAMFNKAATLYKQTKWEEANTLINNLFLHFSDKNEVRIVEILASALMMKGFSLFEQNKPEEAIAVYNDVVSRFSESNDKKITELVERASLRKEMAEAKLRAK